MAQCYDWSSETQTVGKLPMGIWLPCPSGNTCCVGGSVCLDHNLCHVPGSSTNTDGGSYSSYYVARCTDPTYTSPDCQKVCDAPGPPDAVFNYTSTQWNCCGNDSEGNVNCDNPTTEIFQAPAPLDLRELSSGVAIVSTATLASGSKSSSSTVSTTLSSSSASSTDSHLTSNTSTSPATATQAMASPSQTDTSANLNTTSGRSNTSSLSTGAKAGIGIGVTLAVLLLIALIFFLLRRRKQQAATRTVGKSGAEGDGGRPEGLGTGGKDVKNYNSAVPWVLEKDTGSERERSELGAGSIGHVHEIGTSGR